MTAKDGDADLYADTQRNKKEDESVNRKMGRELLDRFYVGARMFSSARYKARYARKRIKMINGGYNGSRKEFNEVVVSYWKKYGVIPKKYWYDIYCAGSDHYDPRYIPDDMWYQTICPHFCRYQSAWSLTNKGMYDRIFPNVRQPEVVAKKMNGCFYNAKNELINREEAIQLCLTEKKLIIKPTGGGGGGRSVQVLHPEEMNPESVSELFDQYDRGFVLQRFLKQHKDLAAIHEKSINTVRVITFLFYGKVYVLSAQLRMGVGDSDVDNVSAGGIACTIKEDGWLAETAVTRKSEWSDHHPNGMKFKDIRVPSYDRIVAKAIELQGSVPFFGIIGWDFAVAEDGEPIMIEFNTPCNQNQIGGKAPTFGDLTDQVLDDVFHKKTVKK